MASMRKSARHLPKVQAGKVGSRSAKKGNMLNRPSKVWGMYAGRLRSLSPYPAAIHQPKQPKIQQEDESAAKCDAVVPAKSDKDKNKHLHPVMSRDEVDEMVNDMKEVLQDSNDPDALAQSNIILGRRNFAMAIIGPTGGKLAFADHSVTMKIPAGALSDTRVISCYRPVDLKNTTDEFKKGDWICYTPELICGPDGTKFNKPISVRMKHMLNISENDLSTGGGFTVITKGDKVKNWQEDKGKLTFDGQWVNIEVDHFTSIGAGNRRGRPVDTFLSTSFTEKQDGHSAASDKHRKPPRPPAELCVFLSGCESKMKDIKQPRYNSTTDEKINHKAYVVSSINLHEDLQIETKDLSYCKLGDKTFPMKLHDLQSAVETIPPLQITHLQNSNEDEDDMLEFHPHQREDGVVVIRSVPFVVDRSTHSRAAPDPADFIVADIEDLVHKRQRHEPPGTIQDTIRLPEAEGGAQQDLYYTSMDRLRGIVDRHHLAAVQEPPDPPRRASDPPRRASKRTFDKTS